VARRVARGEIWLHTFKAPDKRRPVLVLTRSDVIPFLQTVMVAPVTSSVRGAPGEVPLGPDEGLKRPSAANLDHVQTVEQSALHHYVGTLSPRKMADVCRALRIATGCDH
jgi:mRNA interferase MazF